MEAWSDEEGQVAGGGLVKPSEAVQAVATRVQQSGVVLVLIRHEEVTSDWLSFFL